MTRNRRYVPLSGVTIAGGALLVGLLAVPSEAAYSGRVTKSECVSIRQGMSKGYVQNTLFGATGVKVADFYARGNHWRTYSYRPSRSWDQSRSGAGVEYYFSSPDGKWRVSEATCIYIKPLSA